ncbi:GNAT family N-acetyltransferase [Saccharopolyspora rectivirgula]|jgi:ribosomal protein S18 acetylase RimI-like enzyme|uniref:Acetyltransferase n=1 Tax=Saccharopolyspora rectivirgula TaxID=28042 RepID=A0A073B7D9_9PSEU|nr:GNAT family N-acetyltransferase [Saccharopolyspora rectivirgula]KEI43594.1 acetyltransferase [Saccharopolyspora rectivirgula]
MIDRDTSPLDDPVGASLRGHHAHLARRLGRVATYQPEVATFSAVTLDPGPQEWADLARLLGRGALADMFSNPATPPPDWEPVFTIDGYQMVWCGDRPADPEDGVVELGADSAPEMLDLAERTRPGPFWSRTHELGTYLGVREGGALVAMAGERLRPPGWTEISAVCTAPEARGRGHASRLIRALVKRVLDRGDQPFLHVIESNTGALELYEKLGFKIRTTVTFRGFRIP